MMCKLKQLLLAFRWFFCLVLFLVLLDVTLHAEASMPTFSAKLQAILIVCDRLQKEVESSKQALDLALKLQLTSNADLEKQRLQIVSLQSQIETLLQTADNLRSSLTLSETASTELQAALTNLQASFEAYKKKVEAEMLRLKGETVGAVVVTAVVAIAAGVLLDELLRLGKVIK